MIQLVMLDLKWTPAPASVPADRLAKILATWENTPYGDVSDPKPGVSVSCLGFACVVLDALYGRAGEPILELPPDIGLGDPERARAAMRWFQRRYSVERVEGKEIQPGDLLVVTHGEASNPGHLMVVGPRKNTLWHSTETAHVHYTGMALVAPSRLHSIYRCTDRDQWQPN